MKQKYRQISLLLIASLFILVGNAQASNKGAFKSFFTENIDYEVNAQFAIGGSMPTNFPQEIRKIESFNPGLQLGLGLQATKWLCDDQDWGVRLGARFQAKGMKTEARVKNYFTEVIMDNASIKGYYTGLVNTEVKNTYVVIPISVVKSISDRWNIYGGLNVSLLIDNSFTGYVSDGYLRKDVPTGEKHIFEGEGRGPYDFSNDLRTFQWGAQIGGEYALKRNFNIFANLDYDFNNVFKSDFTAITFSMHNIYLNIGFGYKF